MTAWITGAPVGDLGRMDVAAHADRLELLVDVPGVPAQDLDVTVQGNTIVVGGSRARAGGRERFERRLVLAGDVPVDGVAARLSDGVLRISLPRAVQVRQIPVVGAATARTHVPQRVRRPWQRLRARRGPKLRRSLRALADRTSHGRP